jgi:type VI secretion system protein ImpJ
MRNKVVWSEGMFLQPQHFQQQEKYFENILTQKTTAMHTGQWGINTLEIDKNLLKMGKFNISNIAGIFSDGTIFSTPESDRHPDAIEIDPQLNNCLVYIGTPLEQAGKPSMCLEKSKKDIRYGCEIIQIESDIDSINLKCDIALAKLNLKILTDVDDLSQYNYLPIAKISEVRTDLEIILDHNFIPPCIFISSSEVLKQHIEEIKTLIEHRANMISSRMVDTQQSANSEIIDLIILQTVNKYESIFNYLIKENNTRPHELFYHCMNLYSEMSTYTNDKRRPSKIVEYRHNKFNDSFNEIFSLVKESLNIVMQQNATMIELEQKQLGIWTGVINDEVLIDSDNFILAVYSKNNGESIRANLPSQIKIANIEIIKELVSRALPGISIQCLTVAPRQIPYNTNCTYFSLQKDEPLWSKLKTSQAIAVHISSEFNDIKLELWAIKG